MEADELSFKVNGFAMTDFVYPSYFEGFRKPKSTKFDYQGKVTKPFQILAGGYQLIFKGGQWSQIASAAKLKALQREDRRGHRSETRKVPMALRQRSTARK